MNTVLVICLASLAGALAGFVASTLCYQHVIHTLRARVRRLRDALRQGELEPERKQMETMKKIVLACLLNGFAWIWFSYILAAFDKVQIAESLSTAAVTEIVGVVLAYAIKSIFENLSKHNKWPDKDTGPGDTKEDPPEPDDPGTGGVG